MGGGEVSFSDGLLIGYFAGASLTFITIYVMNKFLKFLIERKKP
jgi:hypothetical protein